VFCKRSESERKAKIFRQTMDATNILSDFKIYSLIVLVTVVYRAILASFPYSGQAVAPIHGDYEAQRHWMEITYNLNVRDWYRNTSDNDLSYWGLDYPPLTAYHSQLMGRV
jgi:alpha-1,3-glucosyltransferase